MEGELVFCMAHRVYLPCVARLVKTPTHKFNFVQIIKIMQTEKPSANDPAQPLTEQAFTRLRRDVMMGHFEPGQKLKLDELQDIYGFSSSPLREAMSRLSQEGLIRSDERRGFRVSEINRQDLADITQMRLHLDVLALERAMTLGDDAWEAQIVATHYRLEKLEKNLSDGPVHLDDTWVRAHKDFHMAMIAACQSERLLSWCASLFDQAERYRQFSARHRKTSRRKHVEHKKLVDAVLSRDTATACAMLADHIASTQKNVLAVLDF
jgi:DNA-binding GntR family transcriptional regulator